MNTSRDLMDENVQLKETMKEAMEENDLLVELNDALTIRALEAETKTYVLNEKHEALKLKLDAMRMELEAACREKGALRVELEANWNVELEERRIAALRKDEACYWAKVKETRDAQLNAVLKIQAAWVRRSASAFVFVEDAE